MKKSNLKFLIIPAALLIGYLLYGVFFDNGNTMSVYKSSYYYDCAKDRREPVSEIEISEQMKNNKYPIDTKNPIDYSKYEDSKCVSFKTITINDYISLKDKSISHIKDRNDKVYQYSYQEVLNALEKKENKSEFDNKVYDAFKYYSKDLLEIEHISSDGKTMVNSPLTGPNISDATGKYYPVIDLKILVNEVYKIEKGKKVLDKTKYTIDGISTSYVKEGK